jgi:hypothetical protein
VNYLEFQGYQGRKVLRAAKAVSELAQEELAAQMEAARAEAALSHVQLQKEKLVVELWEQQLVLLLLLLLEEPPMAAAPEMAAALWKYRVDLSVVAFPLHHDHAQRAAAESHNSCMHGPIQACRVPQSPMTVALIIKQEDRVHAAASSVGRRPGTAKTGKSAGLQEPLRA